VVANLDHIRSALERAILAAESVGGDLGQTLGHELSEAFAAILDALAGANHAAAVVRDLKAFSRPAEATQVAIAMQTVVERAVRLVTPQLRHRARVVTEFEDAPSVLGSESLLTQVFVDLLVNAGQALTNIPGPDDLIAVAVRGAAGEAIVDVSDTGAGIPAALLPRIFEPFFTTKPPEIGTGLGLWMCRQIVSAHGGCIEVESAPGRGTRMRVRLPASSPSA
jgi:signal transduction histidine kinase